MVTSKYVNAALPADLAKRVDRLLKSTDLGYRSRQEFVTDAVRQLVLQIEEFGRQKQA
ncbi:MAG: ribbon-helix-helix domain-containing protein [bacterium]